MPANQQQTAAVRPRLQILGMFRLSHAGEEAVLPGRKARAILAYAALAPAWTVTREQLACLLWTDRASEQARASLRQSLRELRELACIAGAIGTTRDLVVLDRGAIEVDLHQIRHAAAAHDLAALAAGLEQVRGQLLEDFLDVSPGFDEWLQAERPRQHDLVVGDALDALEADGLADMRNTRSILRSLDRLDPVNEAVVRLGMRLDHAVGDGASLHRRYRHLCDRLDSEFQTLPSEETRALFHALAANRGPAPPAPLPQGQSPAAEGPSPSAGGLSPTPAQGLSPTVAPARAMPLGGDLVPLVMVAPLQTGDDSSLAALAGFVADDTRVSLSRMRGLQVLGLDAAETPEVLRLSEDALGLYLLSGSLRRLGDDYRVNVQLADAASRVILWSDSMRFTGSEEDLLDAVVGKAAGAVLPAIDRDLYRRLGQASRELQDERAAYTRARLLIRSGGGLAAVQEGVGLLEAIVAANPDHFGARLLLFRMYHTAFWQQVIGHDTQRFRELAEQHLQAAARVEPGHYGVRLGQAWRYLRLGRVEAARQGFESVLATLPHDADMTNACATGLCFLGSLDEAERLMQRAFFLDPFPPGDFHADHGLLLALRGEADAAEEHFAVAGETWLEYTAARIANAAHLERGAERVAASLARFTAGFREAWQPERAPTLADVLDWAGQALPLHPPAHLAWLRQGLERMLGPSWPAARDTAS